MNDMDLDAAAAPLLHDPAYILQLYRRVSCALIKHEDDGRWRFAANFDMLDGRRERATSTSMRTRDDDNGYDPNAAFVALRTIFPSHTLSDKDVAVLLHVLPFDDVDSCTSMEDGALRPAIHGVNREAPPPPPMRRVVDVLRALRELLPWRAWQCAEAIRRGRAFMRAHHRTSSVAEVLRRAHRGEYASSSLCAIDVEQTLVEEAGLTASQAFLLLRYITTTTNNNNNNNNDNNTDEMDFDLLMKMLVADPMPSDVEYPLLAAQFAEATCAPMRGQRPATGSAALLLALENVRDRLEHIEGYDDDDDDDDDLDFGNLMSRRISPRQLYELCHTLRVGFQQRDSDRLYSFLDVERRRCVSVAQLVSMFRRYFPPVSLSMLDLVQAAVVKLMKRSGDQLIFFSLYRRLHTFGIDAIPIEAFIRALRGSGVSEIVSDVELEWLRLSVPTRVGLIHRLCLPISARREGVLGQLFQRLCQDDALMLDSHTLLSRFQPHHVEADTIRRYAIAWRSALMDYVAELSSSDVEEERQSGAPPPPRVDITYDLFAFFWMMFSAAVEDDPTFSMLLWHSFVLADKQRAPR